MPVEGLFTYPVIFGFLFTLARVSGTFAMLPLSAFRGGPDAARILLALGLSVALWPLWTAPEGLENSSAAVVAGMAAEAALGLATGLIVSLALELFQLAAQMVSLQAGLAFASTIDPTSGADSTVLMTAAQLVASLLFFATGADRLLVRGLADSFRLLPPTSFAVSTTWVAPLVHYSGNVFSLGLRLAAPVVILLLLTDVTLAVLGRLQAQLPLLTIALPVKLSAALILMALTMTIEPKFFESAMTGAMRTLESLYRSGH